jgi:general secretion pathway protein H
MGALTLCATPVQRLRRKNAFTLIELLLVIAIAGITLGLVSLHFRADGRQSLQTQAERVASLMQVAGDEAILRNRSILFEADAHSYQFMTRVRGVWRPIVDDDLLRSRGFDGLAVALRVMPDGMAGTVRIVFDPQPIGKSFVLTMSTDDATIGIHADGLGRYVVD